MRVIFLVLDTVRRDYLPAYGNNWVQTPNLDKLAADGVVFDNHWVGSLPCMPARREFMTGRHNFLYRGWGPIEPFDDTLTTALREKNVFTHLLTDHDHYFELGGENYHTGFNSWEFFRGQEHDPWVSQVDAPALPEHLGKLSRQNWKNRSKQVAEEEYSGPRTCAAAVQWLEDNKSADNWFLQVELFDPHEPFSCVEKYRKLYNDTWDGPLFDWPDYDLVRENKGAIEHIRKCYAGLLTMTDHWVGKILAKLEAIGKLEETMIVFTTDHGTLLAEHGYWMKNYMPVYNEIARIPMIIRLPGAEKAGARVAGLTQSIDLMPTILEQFGCKRPPFVKGHSVSGAMQGSSARRDGIFGYFGMGVNITDGRRVYMRHPINADGGPLHAYTAMPVGGLNRWYPRELNEKMEMGRYFGHTYNMPMYKIPATGHVPTALEGQPPYLGKHELYDIVSDPKQLKPLKDEKLEAHFTSRLVEHLKAHEAPAEQYQRLGLAQLP